MAPYLHLTDASQSISLKHSNCSNGALYMIGVKCLSLKCLNMLRLGKMFHVFSARGHSGSNYALMTIFKINQLKPHYSSADV